MSLERALNLAEPEGYVRMFVDEGEAMRILLRHSAAGGIASSYTRRLLPLASPSSLPPLLQSALVLPTLLSP